MNGSRVLSFVDGALFLLCAWLLAPEVDHPDWSFVVPHVLFAILLLLAAIIRWFDQKIGFRCADLAYGAVAAWGVALLVYVAVANPPDGEHLGFYGLLLVLVGVVLLTVNITQRRRVIS
jgi:peptidoglycan/LPS O-acetylase OafA/YrhL